MLDKLILLFKKTGFGKLKNLNSDKNFKIIILVIVIATLSLFLIAYGGSNKET